MKNKILFSSLLFLLFSLFVYSVELKEFYKLFPPIPDWEASEPVGVRIDVDNIYTLRVERMYKNEDKYIKFSIIGGSEAEALWRPFLLKVSYEYDNEWRKIEKGGKELVGVYYNKGKKFGELVLPFEKEKKIIAVFLVEFSNLSSKRALSILKEIDLKELKNLVLRDLEDFKASTEEQEKPQKK